MCFSLGRDWRVGVGSSTVLRPQPRAAPSSGFKDAVWKADSCSAHLRACACSSVRGRRRPSIIKAFSSLWAASFGSLCVTHATRGGFRPSRGWPCLPMSAPIRESLLRDFKRARVYQKDKNVQCSYLKRRSVSASNAVSKPRIHFVGVGGAGISALARLALAQVMRKRGREEP